MSVFFVGISWFSAISSGKGDSPGKDIAFDRVNHDSNNKKMDAIFSKSFDQNWYQNQLIGHVMFKRMLA